MNKRNKLLLALSTIGLSAAAASASAKAAENDGDFGAQCEGLSSQSDEALQELIRNDAGNPCVAVAANLLAERARPAAGASLLGNFGGRY